MDVDFVPLLTRSSFWSGTTTNIGYQEFLALLLCRGPSHVDATNVWAFVGTNGVFLSAFRN